MRSRCHRERIISTLPRLLLAGLVLLSSSASEAQTLSFTHRKPIVIDRSRVGLAGAPTTLTDFPVLVSVTDPSLRAIASGGRVAHPNGYDIVFLALDPVTCNGAASCILAHELETYDGATGALIAWVKVPGLNSISASADSQLFVYYGDSTITVSTADPPTVWNDAFVGVWHLAGPPGLSVADSTGTLNHGTNQNGVTPTAGQIGGAGAFNGTSQHVTTTNQIPTTQDLTVSAWFRTAGGQGRKIIGLEEFQTGTASLAYDRSIFINTAGRVVWFFWNGSASIFATSVATYTDNAWHHAVGTHTSGNVGALYVDGVLQQTNSGNAIHPFSGYWRFGGYSGGGVPGGTSGYFPGSIEEPRVATTARSADWVRTEFNNQSSPSTFLTLGSEEAAPAVPPDLVLPDGGPVEVGPRSFGVGCGCDAGGTGGAGLMALLAVGAAGAVRRPRLNVLGPK